MERFGDETIGLDEAVVLAGPDNSGATTLLQAIATWHAALQHWLTRRKPGETTANARPGVQMLRQQFTRYSRTRNGPAVAASPDLWR